nr:MAG TPA: hypothetical protein [Bacteriophage sp.]
MTILSIFFVYKTIYTNILNVLKVQFTLKKSSTVSTLYPSYF